MDKCLTGPNSRVKFSNDRLYSKKSGAGEERRVSFLKKKKKKTMEKNEDAPEWCNGEIDQKSSTTKRKDESGEWRCAKEG